jgi:hypothetical protein
MRVGDLVKFRETEYDKEQIGLLLRYDKFLKIGEVMKDGRIFYIAGRFLNVYSRGLK